MPTKLTVLVTGATGNQGGAVARMLLKKGHSVKALSRKPESPAAQALKGLGAQIVQGTFEDKASVDRALAGVDAVFAMSTPFEAGMAAETAQGIALADAAKAAGVKHFVFTSVGGADRKTGIPHFDSKFKVEEHIKKIGLPHTILGPVFFMENWISPWFLPALKDGSMAMALPAARSLNQVALGDIAGMAALAIEKREVFLGKRIDIASDDLPGTKAAEILSRVTGRKISFSEVPLHQVRAWSEDFAMMFDWFNKVGYQTDIAGLKRTYPEVGWQTFESWAKSQDWSAIKQAGGMGAS